MLFEEQMQAEVEELEKTAVDIDKVLGYGDSDWEDEQSDAEDTEDLFDRIIQECRHNSPGQCFSAKVRKELESAPPEARARLVSRTRHGAAPLFVACARGALACAAYLLHVCGAPLEQRGLYRAPGDRDLHRVTPLWAAAVAGRLDVLRALADAGADLDAGSDSGSTPLRSACFMSHVAVVRFLLTRGADVRRANHNGGTCLVNSVQSPELMQLLIDAGAEVDAADSQLKTALHYAVQEHREQAALLLLAAGADPLRATREGDDVLQLAAIKGAARLLRTLLGAAGALYTAARVADAYELLGATQLDEYNDAPAALLSWHAATAIRHRARPAGQPIPKRPVRAGVPALLALREWTERAQLDAHAADLDWLRAQALLVCVRVLGPTHKDTMFRLMYRGATFADTLQLSRCAALWSWVLQLRVQRNTLLHTETNQTLLALTRLLLDAAGGGRADAGRGGARAGDAPLQPQRAAVELLRRLRAALPESMALVGVRPACRVQGAMFDRALRCVTHLIYVAQLPPEPALPASQRAQLEEDCREQVRALVTLDPRAAATGDSLLHLACSRLNVVRSTYFADEVDQPRSLFPSCSVARLLLACGACGTARNAAHCTALHVAAIPYNFSTELVHALLAGGAHLDQPNGFGDSPAELVQLNVRSRVQPLHHVTLACRAARALPPGAPRGLPATLRPFIDLHRP